MVQLLEIFHGTREGCIYFGNMYNDFRKVIGVVPGRALLVCKIAGKEETVIYLTLSHGKAMQVVLYFLNLKLYDMYYFL